MNKYWDDENHKNGLITGIASGAVGACILGVGGYKVLQAGVFSCSGTTTILGPCIAAGAVMIGVGCNQISKSNEMIAQFDKRMDDMKIDLDKIN